MLHKLSFLHFLCLSCLFSAAFIGDIALTKEEFQKQVSKLHISNKTANDLLDGKKTVQTQNAAKKLLMSTGSKNEEIRHKGRLEKLEKLCNRIKKGKRKRNGRR